MARSRRTVILTILVLAVGGFVVPKLLSVARDGEAPAPTAGPAVPATLRVAVERVEPRALAQRLATTGTIRANERVDLVSQIAGKVVAIDFDEGRRVSRDQLLVKIDDSELVAERQSVLYQLELAQLREQRQRDLREQGVTSQQEYDLAFNELNVLRAELRLVDAQLLKTDIRAPFAGVVGLRAVSEGSYLTPATTIATLQQVDPVKMDFSVPEQYAGKVRIGGEVTFRVKGSDEPFAGSIYAIEPTVEAATRSLLVRARVPNPDGALVPGAFADVELVIAEVEDALVVPSLAVIPELGGTKVFVLEDGLAQPRQVETGIRTDTAIEVTRGLAAGDRVIVSAIQRLRPGLPVEAMPDSDSAAAPGR